jgi:hypothetical protein
MNQVEATEKAQKLLALAHPDKNPERKEAAGAWFRACRVMADHDLVLTVAPKRLPPPKPRPKVARRRDPALMGDRELTDLFALWARPRGEWEVGFVRSIKEKGKSYFWRPTKKQRSVMERMLREVMS